MSDAIERAESFAWNLWHMLALLDHMKHVHMSAEDWAHLVRGGWGKRWKA